MAKQWTLRNQSCPLLCKDKINDSNKKIILLYCEELLIYFEDIFLLLHHQ